MSSIPGDPDALLTREETAAALTESGYPTSPKTLATKASRGGGPPFHRYGPRVLYRWSIALGWAEKRLSLPIGSTSEEDAARTAAPVAAASNSSKITPPESTPTNKAKENVCD